jgi:hypothetical protein
VSTVKPVSAVSPATPAPLPHREAWPAVARCVATTSRLLVERRVRQPPDHVGRLIRFADGTHGRVYRETVLDLPTEEPAALVVAFRLRWVRGHGHTAFELESELNTPLFVGFPGFRSKLWLTHDENDLYRGLYEWDGAEAAEHYARSLWRVLALVSEPRSIDYRVLPGLRRDHLLSLPPALGDDGGPWWRVVAA